MTGSLGRATTALTLTLLGCGGDSTMATNETTFVVTVRNTSAPGALAGSDGSTTDVVYAPGVWAVFEDGGRLFTPGEAASEGLEHLAEDGFNITLLVAAEDFPAVVDVGGFGQVDGGASYEENPIGPGAEATFEVTAASGQVLALTAMFGQSNDVFVGPGDAAVALFDGAGLPRSGDVTGELSYFDAGTEVNEEPGLGPNQAPRQSAAGAGVAESGTVTGFDAVDASGFAYPPLGSTLEVTLEPLFPR